MFKVAIIGAGIGREHAAGYAKLPELFEIATICDLDRARAQEVASPFGAAVASDLDAVLADDAIDIIDVCLPPHLHLQACLKALEAGKTVVCEKPLVSCMRDADTLAERANALGGKVFPVFQYRYGIGTAQLIALVEAGLAGDLFAGTLETHWNRDAAYYAVDWRGTWAGEQGGAILGHAIHVHDFIPAFLGPVMRVHAELATRVNRIETEDCAALSIRMASGAVLTSSVTLGGAQDMSRIRLMFEGFTAESGLLPYAPAATPWTFTARAPCQQAQIDAVLANVTPAKPGFSGLFKAMGDALQGRGGREVTLEDGRRSLEFVTAVYASARDGAPVTLPLGADHPLYDGWLP